jgi:Retroviral aspartyl protease
VILTYPTLLGRPIVFCVVNDLLNGGKFLVPMLLDTGADTTCFPARLADFFGHNNHHPAVVKDKLKGIGGEAVTYLHSVQISLIDPERSTKESPVTAWTAPFKTSVFVENLDCEFGLLGMDIMKQWASVSFLTVSGKLKIRVVTR